MEFLNLQDMYRVHALSRSSQPIISQPNMLGSYEIINHKGGIWYFLAAMALFGISGLGGLWRAGDLCFSPPQNFLVRESFALNRHPHDPHNALIVWLLTGLFSGARGAGARGLQAYLPDPEESERPKIWSPNSLYQLIIPCR